MMTDKELETVVEKLKKLEVKGREVKTSVEGIRALLREEFTQRGCSEVKTGKYIVRCIKYTQDRLDAAKLKDEHPETYALYARPTIIRKVQIVG